MTLWDSSRIFVLLALCAGLSACREEEDQTLPATAEPAVAIEAADWLTPTSKEDPAAFLAALSGEDAAQIDAMLADAAKRYRENPRMIANRIGQLWTNIRSADPHVTMAQLLTEFTRLDAGPEQSIGTRIQQYRVLRDQGATHEDAMRQLEAAG